MNRTHRTLWNSSLGAYVAAPETSASRKKLGSALAVALTGLMLTGGAWAQTVLNATDRGWVTSNGSHTPSNHNYYTGGSDGYRSFFVFDLPTTSLAPNQVVGSASLLLNTATVTGLPAAGAAFVTSQFTGNLAVLAAQGGTAGFAGLGTGTSTGSASVSSSTARNSTLQVVLNADGLNAIAASLGGRITFGGRLTGTTGVIFSGSSSSLTGTASQLSFTVATLGAGAYYWDLDGRTAGAGGLSPSGAWGRTNAEQILRGLWPADELAPQMGPHLGRGEVLLRRLPTCQGRWWLNCAT